MTDSKPDRRRHDLDLLRVMSFGTLIIYHTSLIYGTSPWFHNISEKSRLMDVIAVGSHPWRMSLLFFISGLVTASLLERRSAAEVRRTRTRQLLLPFLFGVCFIVPPQHYFSQFNTVPELSYWEFWKVHMLSNLRIEHMWFLAYLWIYVFLWTLIFPAIGTRLPKISSGFMSLLTGVKLFLLPVLFLSVIRLWLYPVFGETLVITTDFYSHVLYFSMFVAGALLMGQQRFWAEIDRQRWRAFALAILSALVLAVTILSLPRDQWPQELVAIMRVIRSVLQWCVILSLLAFAARLVKGPSRIVTYLNRSIMTYYLVHQTIIVIAAYGAAQAGLLTIHSFVPIVLITAAICLLIAEAKNVLTGYLAARMRKISARRAETIPSAAHEAAG